MPIELKKNGETPINCQINADRSEVFLNNLEKRIENMENKIDEITTMTADLKEVKAKIASAIEEKKTGLTPKIADWAIIFIFVMIVGGKADPKALKVFFDLFGGS